MAKVISECPSCGGALKIAVLRCSNCGMELHNDFQRSPFDLLTAEQVEFLFSFLTALKKAVLSAQLVSEKEEFSILHPVKTLPSVQSRAAPTLNPEKGEYENSRASSDNLYKSL